MLQPVLLAFVLFQNTWIVDDTGGPGVDFTDIQPAIDAAADGDLVLVRAGSYSHFTLSGKGLRILGEGSTSTVVGLASGPVQSSVLDVPESSVATLERLRFDGTPFGPHRVAISGSTTHAVLADSVVVGTVGPPAHPSVAPAPNALRVVDAEVHVVRSTLVAHWAPFGGAIPPSTHYGGNGLGLAGNARVHVSSSLIRGGRGGEVTLAFPPGGGRGIEAGPIGSAEPWLSIGDSVVLGGDGGIRQPWGFYGPGGNAIHADTAHVRVFGDATSLVQGGIAGGFGVVASGPYAVAVHSTPIGGSVGPVVLDAPPLPMLRASGSFFLGQEGTLSLTNGPANAPFLIGVNERPAYFGIPGPFLGEFLLEPPSVLFAFGTLSAAGDFAMTIPLAGLPPSLAYVPFHLQAAALDGSGVWRLSNATVAILRP